MSDKAVTVELANGTTKTFPAGTPDEYIHNWSERADNRIASQHKDWADRNPMDYARIMAGRGSLIGNVTDYLTETRPRYPEGMPLLGGKEIAPDVLGRGVISRSPPVALGDLATAAYNIPAKQLNEGLPSEAAPAGTTFEGTIPVPFEGGARSNPLPLLTPPSAAIGELAGVRPQAPDAGYLERGVEALLGVMKNPAAGVPIPRAIRPQVPGTALPQPVIAPHGAPGSAGIAESSTPWAARADRSGDVIDRIMERVAPGTDPMAVNRVAGAVGRGTSAAGSVLGGDLGEYLGGDIGALLGSLAGGVAPNVSSALLRTPVRGAYARPGDESYRALQVTDQLGIDASPSLIGNSRAAMTENTAARVPWVGSTAANRQERTARQFENASMEELNRIYDQGPDIQTKDVTGAQMQTAARVGTANLDDYHQRGYDIIDEGVPPEMRIWPGQTRQAVTDIRTPGSGESPATRDLVQNAYDANVARAIAGGEPAPGAPQGPYAGIPYADMRPTGTDLFHSQERANPSAAGAIGIMRRAFAGDTAEALLNDPWMVQRFPDPAVRLDKAQRLQVLSREYAKERSNTADTRLPPTTRPGQGGPTGLDITQQDPGSLPPGAVEFDTGGGSYGAMEDIVNAPTKEGAYSKGQSPDRMAVLQRNAQAQYPEIARNVIGQQWSGPSGRPEPLPVAKTWGPGQKGIGDDAKAILSNDDPGMVARGNLLAEGGELYRERVRADTGSKTMPMMATAAIPMGMMTSPGLGIPAAIAAYAASIGVSGDTFARYLARNRPQMYELLARKGSDAALMAAGQMADDQARAEREGTGFIEEGARAYADQAAGAAQGAYNRLPEGLFFTPPRIIDRMRGAP